MHTIYIVNKVLSFPWIWRIAIIETGSVIEPNNMLMAAFHGMELLLMTFSVLDDPFYM